ncbi:MAG TPA: substrate-binding domain-containing protein [Gammaproteobacteria bacterium]|nr:substrate-binding domain-containing protein [Gammaproteobacteria bacterium]
MCSDADKALLMLAMFVALLGAMAGHFAASAGLQWALVPVARAAEAPPAVAEPLRVCADPNNLPFSNQRGEGFENVLARLLARELGRALEYTWWPQRRGFIRHTLDSGRCDLVMGVPADFERVTPTAPYYRSGYVFVTRADRHLDLKSLDDPRLRKLSIGLHAIGDDYANVPPAQALAARGIVDNVRGYSVYGDYSLPDPPRVLIDAVARGEVDVAIAWGPLAGYFAPREPIALTVTPVIDERARDPAMQFSIAAGVRHGDTALKTAVERVFAARRAEIDEVLRDFHVPLLAQPEGKT